MINNQKNNFNLKKSIVETPKIISEKIYQDLKRKHIHTILDIGAYRGELSKSFRRKRNIEIIGIDVIDIYKQNFDHFIHKDFLQTTKKDFEKFGKIDLILTNPPFQAKGNIPYPQLFLQHIFKIFPKTTPVVIIVPNYFLYNSKNRYNFFNTLNITKNIVCHKSIFENVKVETNILYINIKTKTHQEFLYLKNEKEERKRYFRSIALSKEQQQFINQNIKNFNRTIKELLKKEYPDFPN